MPELECWSVYADLDGDGHGAGDAFEICHDQEHTSAVDGDCDDENGAVHPGATETCDGTDNDCDGSVDDDDDDVEDLTDWYADTDGDGFGSGEAVAACDPPEHHAADAGDCDDARAEVHPGAEELCDGIDNDCDDATGEAETALFVSEDGVLLPLTDALSGSSDAPAEWSLTEQGDLWFCEGTWFVNLDVESSVSLWGRGATTLDGGEVGTVLSMAGPGLEVAVSGLTIQGGSGDEPCTESGYLCGGGLSCRSDGTSTLGLESVAFLGNVANHGGALAIDGCDVAAQDVLFSGNSASNGGAVAMWGGNLDLNSSQVLSNVANSGGGGVYLSSQSGTVALRAEALDVVGNSASEGGGIYVAGADVVLSNSTVQDNHATYDDGGGLYAVGGSVELDASLVRENSAVGEGGGLFSYSTDVVCDGSGADAGFIENTATEGGGIYIADPYYSSSSFVACDFGTSSVGDDNEPDDIYGSYALRIGDGQSFSCTGKTCGPPATHSLGGATSSGTDSGVLGTVVLADSPATLVEFGFATKKQAGTCEVQLYVLSAGSASATSWTVEWVDRSTWPILSTLSTVGGSEVGLVVSPGVYYALAYDRSCSAGEAVWYRGTGATDAGFGSEVGRIVSASGDPGWSKGDIVELENSSSSSSPLLDVEVVDLN